MYKFPPLQNGNLRPSTRTIKSIKGSNVKKCLEQYLLPMGLIYMGAKNKLKTNCNLSNVKGHIDKGLNSGSPIKQLHVPKTSSASCDYA